MIYELNHLGIVVEDLDRTAAFYTKLFGAREIWRTSIEPAGVDILYLQVAGSLLEFLVFRDGSRQVGTDHFGFLTDDLDADYAALVAAGYESAVEPKVSGSGVGRQAFILDSDTTRIELLQRDRPTRLPVVEHPIVLAVDHIALLVDDLDRSLALYSRALGMETVREVEMPAAGVSVTYLGIGGDVIEFLPKPTDGPRIEHIALRVPDVDAALQYFIDAGETPDGQSRAASSGIGRLGSITDPDGVVIEVLDRPGIREL
jgi:catechol 2,3-dioxygenase-like lactoylglutathione lyase family enzyme